MRKFFLYMGAMLSFSLSTLALDYVCEGETVRFSFVNGDPARDARLQVNNDRIYIATTRETLQDDGLLISGYLNDNSFRSFSILIKKTLEFETSLRLESENIQELPVHCTLIMI